MTETIAIIGAGVAGLSATEALREHGYTGEVLLFNEEAEAPYDRPPLSKAYAAGTVSDADIALRPEPWFEERRITHFQGSRVTEINPAEHFLLTESGQHRYDKLLLATGARARCPAGLDASHPHVLLLRTAADARRLRGRLVPGIRVILVGGGVIGMECAATAVKAGCIVTVLEGLERVMSRFLSPDISDYVTGRHRAEGATVYTNFAVASIVPGADGAIVTGADGMKLDADLVLVGIGAAPETGLAKAAGLAIEAGGIAVDAQGRTSAEDVFAVGDCTAIQQPDGSYKRFENWTHAARCGQLAAMNMLGAEQSLDFVPWVWSDQYDMNIQVTGEPFSDKMVLRGTLESGRFTALHLDTQGVLVGATTINQGRDKRALEKLIAGRARIPAEQLSDPAVELKKVVLF